MTTIQHLLSTMGAETLTEAPKDVAIYEKLSTDYTICKEEFSTGDDSEDQEMLNKLITNLLYRMLKTFSPKIDLSSISTETEGHLIRVKYDVYRRKA